MESSGHSKNGMVGDERKEAESGPKHSGRNFLMIVLGIIVFFVLALGLGLGLGLRLKHHSSNSAQNSTSSTTTTQPTATATGAPVGISRVVPPWRRDPAEYNMDMSWDINAKPATRIFNLTVSKIIAAPDGNASPPNSNTR